MTQPIPMLLDLADCRDKAIVGGKAVNLGALIRAGFAVPGGFAITTAAFRFARSAGNHHVPTELQQEIRNAWRALGSPAVAVRSSATAEDLFEASMAGQYETFLDVSTEEDLFEKIQCCWASLQSPRVRTYLAEHGIAIEQVSMAVVVQKLIPADVAGVLFSANPQTGSRAEMLVEASWGLGESVVSGRVQPDVLRLDRASGRVLAATISDKQVYLRPGDHHERPVEDERRKSPCLKSGDVHGLWQLGKKAADHFGGEQDIEWAIHDGQLYLLQSRPITTLAAAETHERLLQETRSQLRALLDQQRGPWVLHNISETLKHPTPLTWSIIRRFMSGSGGFGNMYRQAGFEPSVKVCADGFLVRIAGRPYMDLSLASEMFFEDYPFKYDLDQLRASPDAAQAPPTIPAGTFQRRMAVGRKIGAVNEKTRAMAADFDINLTNTLIPEFVAYCQSEKARDLASLNNEELIEQFAARQKRVLDEFAPQSLIPSMIAAMGLADLRALIEENFWDDDPDVLAAEVSSAHAPDQTLLANARLYEVAVGRRSADEWLAEYGHRCPDEFDLATPRWREQPEQLLELAARLNDGADPAAIHETHLQKTAQKLDALAAQLPAKEAAELRDRIEFARRYLRFREDGKFHLMLGYDLLRDVALEAGRRLEIGDDVFQLSLEELTDALRVGFAPLHLIAQRKMIFAAEARISTPFIIDAAAIDTLGQPPKLDAASSHPAFALSAGLAGGPARIVHSPQEAGDLGKGYVLVCPSTDPNWTPLFVNAAALILECGGTLSHGAVVAREMNIPAVVLANATTLFTDGELIEVDGRHGAIRRKSAIPTATDNGLLTTDSESIDNQKSKIENPLIPPVPGRRERFSATLRNWSLLIWGIYLALAFLLPEKWLYRPTMKLFDIPFWPLVRNFGKPAAVAIIAAGVALITMLAQRFLTDNARLREAKRRVSLLYREADLLPADSPRAIALEKLAGPVQIRIMLAALVPLAVLLGPMVMSFMWFPERVDPAAWNPPANATIPIKATIHSDVRTPITLSAGQGLEILSPTSQQLPRIRETLERTLRVMRSPATSQPSDINAMINSLFRDDKSAELDAFLKSGVPPQSLTWLVQSANANKPGKFPVTLSTPGQPPLTVNVVLGDEFPPDLLEIRGREKGLISLEAVYPKLTNRKFWISIYLPFKWGSWDVGWLSVYLVVYMPVMFAAKTALKIA